MTSHIKLYGEKEARFEEIKDQLAEEFGFKPTNPEVIGILMANYDHELPLSKSRQ